MALLTIDDAIAAFVACEPGDEAARRRLRERLWSLVADKRFAPPVRMSLADAIAVLDDPSEFKGDREAAGLEKVRNHLEIAVDHDENGDRAMSEPEPAPVPRDVTPMGIPVVPAPAAVGAPAAPATFTIGDDCDRALIEDFAAEAREYLENAEAALLRLAQLRSVHSPRSPASLFASLLRPRFIGLHGGFGLLESIAWCAPR